MPKKQPRNAYYFFMLDFKEEQRKKGINYQNMTEVQVAADPVWRNAHSAVRAKFEEMAKAEKQKLRGAPDRKFTSNGMPLSEIKAQEDMLKQMQEQETREITNFVTLKSMNNKLLEADIFLIDVNTFCFSGSRYLMAESTVLRFSLLEGIKDTYHEIIHPGRIPIGYASDVKLGSIELGLEMPDEDKPKTEFPKILAYLMDYLNQNSDGKDIPPLYTLPEKLEQTQDFIKQLCYSSGEETTELRVYKLDSLFFQMVNTVKYCPEDSYPKLSLAVAQLKKDPFKYTPGLACERHEEGERAVECSKSRVQRWAYTVLDKCCPAAGVRPAPGRHVPRGLDLESVFTYKERNGRMESRAPSTIGSASCNSSVFNESYDGASNAWEKLESQTKRRHVPLRLPKIDYSQSITQAPDLSEAEFPKLDLAKRGRSVSQNMSKMSLNE